MPLSPLYCNPSQLPNATPLQEHGQIAIFADLENGSMQRGGQAGQGPRALDRAAQLEALGSDPQDRTKCQEPAVMVDHDGSVQACDRLENRRLEIG